MKALWLELRIMYYELAAREIDPLHADVPQLTLHLNELKLERAMRLSKS